MAAPPAEETTRNFLFFVLSPGEAVFEANSGLGLTGTQKSI